MKSYLELKHIAAKRKKERGYRAHDLQFLIRISKDDFGTDLFAFESLCFRLTKCYHFYRYPEGIHLLDQGISSVSTEMIHEVDEFFLHLFEILPIPEAVKCRVGILGLMLIANDLNQKGIFVQGNEAYLKRGNLFSKSFRWWNSSDEERITLPNIEVWQSAARIQTSSAPPGYKKS